MEKLRPKRLTQSNSAICEMESTIHSMERRVDAFGCSQFTSECREKLDSEEERAIISERAITDFLQASIDFEEAQSRTTNRQKLE
jgi:hypothetical protein